MADRRRDQFILEKVKDLTDDQLREKTAEFRKRIDEATEEIKAEVENSRVLKEDILIQ